MASKLMWMGPRGREQWVAACAISPDFSGVGWQSKTQYLNGGAGVRSSWASHKEYSMTWPINSRDALRPITDMASGMLGTGLVSFLDPLTLDKNVLAEHWAFPGQAALDGPVLSGDDRPDAIVSTVGNALGYPSQSVAYKLDSPSLATYVPIPPGYVAWFGWHGASDGWGGVRVRTLVGDQYGDESFPDALSVTDVTRFNASFSSASFTGIEIDLAPGDAGSATLPAEDLYPALWVLPDVGMPATTVLLSGLMLQILPIGAVPSTGGFISGQGNSGCKFESKPLQTPYSVGTPGMEVAMSAKLIEVGSWL